MSHGTFVLIHGAFHGGWCWEPVASRLRALGHRVLAPSLTGLADRSHLASFDVNLSTHIQDVVNLLRWEGLTDVTLCGHSYGGMVIAGAAEQAAADTIRSLVFLDALIPRDGLALVDYLAPADSDAASPSLEIDAATGLIAPPPAAAFVSRDSDREWLEARLTPQPLGTFTEKLSLAGAFERVERKTFILCTGESGLPSLRHQADALRGQPRWQIQEMDCKHDAMIEDPDRVAQLLLEA